MESTSFNPLTSKSSTTSSPNFLRSVSHEEKLSSLFLLERPIFEENEILLRKPRRRIFILAVMKMISFRVDFQQQLRIFSATF